MPSESSKDPNSELAAVLAFFFNVDLAQEVVRERSRTREGMRVEDPPHVAHAPASLPRSELPPPLLSLSASSESEDSDVGIGSGTGGGNR